MEERGRFTDRVRQELSRLPIDEPAHDLAELAVLLRLAGALHLTGRDGESTQLTLKLSTTSGAVARRAFALLQAHAGVRPGLAVRAPSGVQRRTTYAVVVGPDSAPQVAFDLGLLDADGRPTARLPAPVLAAHGAAALRGAVLGSASFSAPGRAPHLELSVRSQPLAEQVGRLVASVVPTSVSTGPSRSGWRVVCKSREGIGAVLAAVGATGAFLSWEEQRLRRELRNDAQRLANADAANLRRSIDAAAAQTQMVEQVIADVGWDELDDDLRQIALARLANPSASLAELGELCDPPVGKSAVHRRMKRLEQLAADGGSGDG